MVAHSPSLVEYTLETPIRVLEIAESISIVDRIVLIDVLIVAFIVQESYAAEDVSFQVVLLSRFPYRLLWPN